MTDPLQPGDVVKLKSGGPAMTVRKIGTDGEVEVNWFNDKGEDYNASFPPVMLRWLRSGELL